MALRYKITSRKDNIKGEEKKFIMQAISTGTVDAERIALEISRECSLSEVDVQAVIMALGQKLRFHLEEGEIVELGDLGRFKLGIKSPTQNEASALHPSAIKAFRLNFQPSKKMKHWLKSGISVRKVAKK